MLLLLPLLGIRRRWSARLLQAALLLGAAEWARTLYLFASNRSRAGEPVTRLVVILGSVALVALLSALLIQTGRARRWFRIGGGRSAGEPSAPAPT